MLCVFCRKKEENRKLYGEEERKKKFIQLTDDRNQLQFLQLFSYVFDELIIFTLNMRMIALPDDKWRVRFFTLLPRFNNIMCTCMKFADIHKRFYLAEIFFVKH